MTFKLEILRLEDYEAGVRKYWEVTRQRASCVQESEDEFPQFPEIYKKRIPPHFTREDLQEAIKFYAANNVFTGVLREVFERLQRKLPLG